MLTETAFEVLHFFSRVELEELQMHSSFLRDVVDCNVNKLPLRPIFSVETCVRGGVRVSLEKEGSCFKVAEPTHASLRLLFDRIRNAFVERFEVTFLRGSDGARFFGYLRDHAAGLQCRIDALCIGDFLDPRADVDYALIDFVVSRLKPQNLRTYIFDTQQSQHISCATLLGRASMRGTLRHAHLDDISANENMMAANCAIPVLLDVDALQTCAIRAYEDATHWVMFMATCRGANVVRSVTVVRELFGDVSTPRSDAFSPLATPQSEEVPAPRNDFVKGLCRGADRTESTAELYTFKNIQLGKRLNVYKWTAEGTRDYGTGPQRRLAYLSSSFFR